MSMMLNPSPSSFRVRAFGAPRNDDGGVFRVLDFN